MTGVDLVLADVRVRAGRRTILSLERLAFQPGLTAIVGPNGAGKTSLLRVAAGLHDAGEVHLGGRSVAALSGRERARMIAYLPQEPLVHWPLVARAVVALGRYPHARGGEDDDRATEAAMARAGVTPFADRPVSTLSGGERARVALARALAVEAPVLIADEPAASLDPAYQVAVFDVLKRLADEGHTVVVVTHDLNAVLQYAERCVVLHQGEVVADGSPEIVLDDPLLRRVFDVSPLFVDVGERRLIAAYEANG